MDNIPQDDIPCKQCSGTCGRSLPATAEFFSRDKTRTDGLQYMCKECTKEYKRQHYQRNRENIRKKHKDYYDATREIRVEQSKQHYRDHKEQHAAYGKEYRETHKDRLLAKARQYHYAHRDRLLEYHRNYYRKNRERLYKHQKQYYAVHRDEHIAYLREYRRKNKDVLQAKEREYGRRNRERKRAYLKAYQQSEAGRMVYRANRQKRRVRKEIATGHHTAAQLRDQLRRQKGKCYWCKRKLGKGKGMWHADHVVPLSRGGSNDISNIVISCPTCNLRKHNRLPHEWSEGGHLM